MNRRVLATVGVLSLLSMLFFGLTAAAMEPDARSYAMGGAYTAVVNDASAIYWNPAMIPDINITSLMFSLGLGSEDLDQTLDAIEKLSNNEMITDLSANAQAGGLAAISTKWFGVGAYGEFSMDVDADATIDQDFPPNSTIDATAAASARGNGVLAIAKRFSKFNVGLGLKAVMDGRAEQTSYSYFDNLGDLQYDKSYLQVLGEGYSTDLALSSSLTKMVKVGLVFQDAFSSINYEQKDQDGTTTKKYTDKLDPVIRAGVALRPGLGFTFASDVTNTGQFSFGAEKNLFWNGLSLRAGVLSKDGESEYRAGLGLNILALHVDAGVGISGEKNVPVGAMINASLTF